MEIIVGYLPLFFTGMTRRRRRRYVNIYSQFALYNNAGKLNG